MFELGAPGRGEPVTLSRATPAHVLPGRGGDRLGVTPVDQDVEVTPDAGRGDTEFAADLGGGDRSRFQQQPYDLTAGPAVLHRDPLHGRSVRLDFHNISVTQLDRAV